MYYSATFTDRQIPAITAMLACCRIAFEYIPLPNNQNKIIIKAEDAAIAVLLPFSPQHPHTCSTPGRLPLHSP